MNVKHTKLNSYKYFRVILSIFFLISTCFLCISKLIIMPFIHTLVHPTYSLHSYTQREIPQFIIRSSNSPNRVCCGFCVLHRLCWVCRAGFSAGLKPSSALERVCCTVSCAEAPLTRARRQCLLRGSFGRSCRSPVLVDGLYLTPWISRLSWLFFSPLPKISLSRRYYFGSATLLKWISARGLFLAFSLSFCQVIFALIQLGVYGPTSLF